MPRNLSSSVSMFIEDSRVAAVANANASPVNPANFYTISNVRHTPNITPAGDVPRQRPTTLNIHSQPSSLSSSSGYGTGPFETLGSRSPREIIHRIHQEGEEDSWSSMSGVSSLHFSNSDPPYRNERQRVSVSVQPMTPWLNVRGTVNNNSFAISSQTSSHSPGAAGGLSSNNKRNEDRAYTSVNLHLKSPPDSNCEYSCSTQTVSSSPGSSSNYIRIPVPGNRGCCHGNCVGGANSSVTYSTYSNCRDGFESQLQIQIGPQGGTISATRRRNSGGITRRQQMNADLLATQRDGKRKLEQALGSKIDRLQKLKTEITALRSKCQPLSSLQMEQLRAQNRRLQLECEIMTEQVDMYNNGSIPLGETNEEFYQKIYAGQDANSLVRNTAASAPLANEVGRWPRGSGRGKPPPRPPPPRFLHLPPQHQQQHHQQQQPAMTQSGEWCCTVCTFRNHPDLNQCEQCNMIRVPPSRCRGPNIRIRFVRHPHDEQSGHPGHMIHSSWIT